MEQEDDYLNYELDEEIGQRQDELFAAASLEVRQEGSTGIRRQATLKDIKKENKKKRIFDTELV